MFSRAAPHPLEHSPADPPDEKDTLARGKWLLTAASCGDCHTTQNAQHAPMADHYLAGGNPFPIGKGVVHSSNLTSDPATGIGAYTDEDILRVLNEGKGKSGRLLYVMPWRAYQGLTDGDKRALIAALRQVPAVTHIVPPFDGKI